MSEKQNNMTRKKKRRNHQHDPQRQSKIETILSKHADLNDPDLYENQEISWLRFNERVLGEAEDETQPLLERVKFVSIFHSNLDEFFMVRLSRLLRLTNTYEGNLYDLISEEDESELDEMLDEVGIKVRQLLVRANYVLYEKLIPEMRQNNISLISPEEWTPSDEKKISEYFEKLIHPALTPLAIDPAHPLPYLTNLGLYLAVNFDDIDEQGEPRLAVIEIPSQLNRFVSLSRTPTEHKFVLIEDIVKKHLDKLFWWPKVSGAYCFRVTRNLDYQLLEGDVKDLVKSLEYGLKDRSYKVAVRLEVESTMPRPLRERLRRFLDLDPEDVYSVSGYMNERDLVQISRLPGPSKLRDVPFNPRLVSDLSDQRDMFEALRKQDYLIHHPFDSFGHVIDFIERAADDPAVIAIKQTLYRTGGDSPIIEALVRAAENGKQVTVVVELKARFDERNNIAWARRLEQAGVKVVYGFVELKTHAKILLVIRRETDALKTYAHLSTGNYSSATAKFYTDLGFFTADAKIGQDLVNVFNLLTGFDLLGTEEGRHHPDRLPTFEKLKIAPFGLREFLFGLIEQEVQHAVAKKPAYMILKMNALTDMALVKSLYRASQMGVKIDLIVRGICILRPGVAGISENIRVLSVVDRYLEHSRIYWFQNQNDARVYLGSADWMPRNLDRRVESVWPIESDSLKKKVKDILDLYLKDQVKVYKMQPDGDYIRERKQNDQPSIRAQEIFMEIANRADD